jgi:hypothetical protein
MCSPGGMPVIAWDEIDSPLIRLAEMGRGREEMGASRPMRLVMTVLGDMGRSRCAVHGRTPLAPLVDCSQGHWRPELDGVLP